MYLSIFLLRKILPTNVLFLEGEGTVIVCFFLPFVRLEHFS